MFKEFFNGLKKMIGSNNKWVLLILFLILAFALYSYSSSKKEWSVDTLEDGTVQPPSTNAPKSPPQNNQTNTPLATSSNLSPPIANYALQPIANPSELLPADVNSEWAALNPIGNGNIQTPDLLQAGYHIGIDTIGQTLRNPSYDLRSDPIIEKKNVSPWNNSTIEPDLARVPLEVGYGGR
jgi:hypothetical protein